MPRRNATSEWVSSSSRKCSDKCNLHPERCGSLWVIGPKTLGGYGGRLPLHQIRATLFHRWELSRIPPPEQFLLIRPPYLSAAYSKPKHDRGGVHASAPKLVNLHSD